MPHLLHVHWDSQKRNTSWQLRAFMLIILIQLNMGLYFIMFIPRTVIPNNQILYNEMSAKVEVLFLMQSKALHGYENHGHDTRKPPQHQQEK